MFLLHYEIIFGSPPHLGFHFEEPKHVHSNGVVHVQGNAQGEEAMDTTSSPLSSRAVLPQSPVVATKNTTHKRAFPGTKSRPSHLQMMS